MFTNQIQQEVQMQWTPSQRAGYQSNQQLLHHYQHSKNYPNSSMHS